MLKSPNITPKSRGGGGAITRGVGKGSKDGAPQCRFVGGTSLMYPVGYRVLGQDSCWPGT